MNLVRLLAAVLLLADYTGVYKVLCVSPAGHEAVEDSMAPCCVPGMGMPGRVFSQTSPCEGCADYSFAPTTEIATAQADSSATPTIIYAAGTLERFQSGASPSIKDVLSVQGQIERAGAPHLAACLRC